MRTFSTLAVLAASLLVKDVFASPLGTRSDVVVEVSEEVTVVQGPDGKLTTGQAVAVKTVTNGAAPPVQQAPASVAPPASSATVFQQENKAAKSSPPPAAKPTTTAVAQPAPTTLATSAKTSAAPSSVPSSTTPTTSGGGKRGLAYNDVSLLADFPSNGKISWAYNWASGTKGNMPKGVEYVPMLWGNTAEFTKGWKAAADSALASGSTHLLGFNEPDHPVPQANIDWKTAQGDWKTYMNQYVGKAKLGSPAVTNGVTGSDGHIWGLDWLNKFMSDGEVAKTVDFIAVHWYGGPQASVAESLADLQQHMRDSNKAANGRPVWLTEFQYLGPGDAADFVSKAVQWMDEPAQSYIERYSYFMVSQGSMIDGAKLSKVGNSFATA